MQNSNKMKLNYSYKWDSDKHSQLYLEYILLVRMVRKLWKEHKRQEQAITAIFHCAYWMSFLRNKYDGD